MSHTIPIEISLKQQADAVAAFCEVIGISPMSAYFPLIVTRDAVMFPAVPPQDEEDDSVDRPRGTVPSERGLVDPQGQDHSELSVMVTIKVVD